MSSSSERTSTPSALASWDGAGVECVRDAARGSVPTSPPVGEEAAALIKVGKGFVEFDQTGTFVSHT